MTPGVTISGTCKINEFTPNSMPAQREKISKVWPAVWWRGDSPRRLFFTRPWVSYLSWSAKPSFLRWEGRRKHRLFAGPWVGEFGWELMNWQGYIRALRPAYEQITVCSRASSKALYADCCDSFIPHDIRGQANSHVIFDLENPDELAGILSQIPPDCDHLPPLRYIPRSVQRFRRFGRREQGTHYAEVLIHARKKESGGREDWAESQWNELIDKLRRKSLRVGGVGLSSATLNLSGIEDYRDIDLKKTMNLMAAAKLVIGPSSGPMHLASLCGTPHLVWTDRRTYGMRKTSREKYETWWNPLQTPVQVLDQFGFNPPVEDVKTAVFTMLESTPE